MVYRKRMIVGVLAAALLSVAALAPLQAKASEEGRRNTALGLGAASLYLLSRKDTRLLGVVGVAGTAYATKLYYDDINKRHQRERAAASKRASSAGRASTSHTTSAASLASRPDVKALISSAYKKGMNAGYKDGYQQGLLQAKTVTVKPTQTAAPKASETSGAYDRVLVAMRN